MHRIKSILFGVALTFTVMSAWGQAAKSPFTAIGLGDIYDLSLAHNQGMGGIGLSNGSYWYLNNMNPALLPYNSLTVFSAGLIGEYRNVRNDQIKESNGGGNLNYLATAFPVKPGIWTTSVGLMPYSNVDYQVTSDDQKIDKTNTDVRFTEEGSGGINQLYWSNGVALNKRFFVGLKATYLFSGTETKFSNTIQNLEGALPFSPTEVRRLNVSDFLFSAGLAFNQDSIFNTNLRLKLGVTYDFESEVNAKLFRTWGLELVDQPVLLDTLSNNVRGDITLPRAFGAGISLNNGLKWTVGIDARMQQWTDYKNFSGNNEGLGDGLKVSFGGEITPDYGSVSSYLKRITYRAGLSFEETPYVVNNHQVKDFGINFGWSLPVGRYSSLDMAFKYGKRGDVQETTISENYYKVYLGFNFNDRWFVQRKYD